MPDKNHLRLKRHYSIVAHSPDIVELRYGIWNPVSFTLTDESETGHLFNILSHMDGSVSPSELAKREGISEEEIQALLDHLIGLGVVESSSSSALDSYLENIAPILGRNVHIKPENSSVVLVGDSELTGEIERYLKMSLPEIDLATVNRSDSVMSVLSKNDATWLLNGLKFQENLLLFNNWRDKLLIVGMKVINPVKLRILNRICLALRIPWIHAAQDGPFLFVGPVFVPYRTACYECFETRVVMNLREAGSYQQYKRALVEGQVKVGSLPIEPVLLGLLASLTSFETMNYLLTQSAFTVGKVLSIYLPTMEFSFNEVLRSVSCTACSPLPGRDDRELYFDARAFIEKSTSKIRFNGDRQGTSKP